MTFFAYAAAPVPLIEGMDQSGYIARFGGAAGTLDAPQIKVLLLRENYDAPVALVFCDLIGFSPEDSCRLAKRVGALVGTDPARVLITCTHTHAAPASMCLLMLGECRESWFSRFVTALCGCVKAALSDGFEQVRISFGKTAVEGIARNRVRGDLRAVDTDETVLLFAGKRRRVALVNYACHPVVLPADNRLYSRDYPGVLEETVLAAGAADAVIFATAPCGDLNPIEQDNKGEDARRRAIGAALGNAAAALINKGALLELPGPSCGSAAVTLPLLDNHKRADLWAVAKQAKEQHAAAENPVKRKYWEALFLYAAAMQCLKSYGISETQFCAPLFCLRFGAFSIFGVPFELFSDIGIHIKERFAPACVFELAGGNFGYFPSDELWEQASYERGDAYMYYCRGGPIKRGGEEFLLSALETLV